MLTPVDIETKEFKKSAFGYSIGEVDSFLDEVIEEYEKLFKENAKLQEKVADLTEIARYYKDMEDTIKNSIVMAEKNAENTKAIAEKEADQIIKNAESHAESMLQNTRIEESKLRSRITSLKAQYEGLKGSLKSLLETQIKMLDVHSDEFKLRENIEE